MGCLTWIFRQGGNLTSLSKTGEAANIIIMMGKESLAYFKLKWTISVLLTGFVLWALRCSTSSGWDLVTVPGEKSMCFCSPGENIDAIFLTLLFFFFQYSFLLFLSCNLISLLPSSSPSPSHCPEFCQLYLIHPFRACTMVQLLGLLGHRRMKRFLAESLKHR